MVSTLADLARNVAAAVLDPELPALTIADLGVLRDVRVGAGGRVDVTITPTYSGCPALAAIRGDVVAALATAGFDDVRVTTVLSPAWSTDWMTEAGRTKLAEYGIAPPPRGNPPGGPGGSPGPGGPAVRGAGPVPVALGVRCPQCGSVDTEELTRFGSTSCQSLWRCRACREPYSHFKAL